MRSICFLVKPPCTRDSAGPSVPDDCIFSIIEIIIGRSILDLDIDRSCGSIVDVHRI